MLAYDEFYAKYPDGEINKEQFMEVSKVQLMIIMIQANYDNVDDNDYDDNWDDDDDVDDDDNDGDDDDTGGLPCRISVPSL